MASLSLSLPSLSRYQLEKLKPVPKGSVEVPRARWSALGKQGATWSALGAGWRVWEKGRQTGQAGRTNHIDYYFEPPGCGGERRVLRSTTQAKLWVSHHVGMSQREAAATAATLVTLSSLSSSSASSASSAKSATPRYILPNGRLRICATKFDPRPLLSFSASIQSALSTLIDLDCSPSLLEFKTPMPGEILRRRSPGVSYRSAWKLPTALLSLSLDRLQRISFYNLPHLTMGGMEHVLDHCHQLVSLSLAGTRITHTALLATVTRKAGSRLQALNLCGSLQLNESLLNTIGSRCPHLKLLNIAACGLKQDTLDRWLVSPYNLPTELHGLNISCNPDLCANLPDVIARITGAFPSLAYLTFVVSCGDIRVRELRLCF